MLQKFKEFAPTSWAIDNRTSIFIVTIIITLAGLSVYNSIPKEQFPEIVIPTMYVSTVYPGTSPSDMENLVTKPIEKQLKSISGVKKFTSNSLQDFSNIIVEFNTDVEVAEAKQKVKDAVDKSRTDLPNDLPAEPTVIEVDFAEIPVMFVNISGDYDLNTLKKYAENLQDKIEGITEVTRVDLVGALEREIQIDVDMYKLQAAKVTMGDIERAIAFENMTISGGNISEGALKRSVRVVGEFKEVSDLNNIIVTSLNGTPIYLKDLATITDGVEEQESYARLNGKNVITLNVIKKSGENLISTSDKVQELIKVEEASGNFPPNLKITTTGDQSVGTRTTVHDLVNTIIIGFILVTLVMMFFMGPTNALFVGSSVPISAFLAFMVMPSIGFTLNVIVLFSFLLALGVVVDDAIVVTENTHRLFANGKRDIKVAAKMAAGEIFIPVLAGTLTTIAPFLPLAFWGGIVGKFMYFLPVTLIITLVASLIVAYIMNPVFAVQFMKPDSELAAARKNFRSIKITSIILAALAAIFYAVGVFGGGNFLVFLILLLWFNRLVILPTIDKFQENLWPKVQNAYERILRWCLKGWRPQMLLIGTFLLLILSVVLVIVKSPKVEFFPKGDPNFIYVYMALPVGTDQKSTDSVINIVEQRVTSVFGKNNPLVESIQYNVAVGAGDPAAGDRAISPNKAKVSVAFVPFAQRDGVSTAPFLDSVRKVVRGIPGAEITVDQESGGPPTGKPINIEVSGDKFEVLIDLSTRLKKELEQKQIAGVEELKSDLQSNKPELIINIDRERASREGISTAVIGGEIRNAIFGKEVSKYKDDNDEYPIMLRYQLDQRNDIEALINTKITFRDMNAGGMIRQIPLSAVADISYTNSFGAISRKNQKRVITISSNILSGFAPNEVVANVQRAIDQFQVEPGYEIKMTGEQEEQAESAAFLSNAMLISIGLIFLILVTQFNSLSKPIIIISEILFSIIGVLLGFVIFDMTISIVMTGIGVVALAGIVVKNGILLVEYTDLLLEKGAVRTREAIVQAGRIRMTPVILTATSTILGLIPLAIGLNIDFYRLFTELNPHFFLGGDSVAFFGPLSWTIIFGLTFATFLTLILVPVMYYLNYKMGLRFRVIRRKLRMNRMRLVQTKN